MAVEWKNYVKDLTKGEMLEKGVFEKKEWNEYILSEETETAINNKVESSFQEFLNSEWSKTEIDFNNWLDNDVKRILDTEKIKEIKTNNNNIEEALKSLNFTIELWNLQQTIQEQREWSATTEEISQGHYIEEQANLKNLNESIIIEWLIKSQVKKEELQNLLNTIRTTNFTERDYIVDCLNSWKKEDIRKIQYLLIWKKENYIPWKWWNKEWALSGFWTDWLMGSETFNALNNYITNNKKAWEQVTPAEQTNETNVTENSKTTQNPTIVSNQGNNNWSDTQVKWEKIEKKTGSKPTTVRIESAWDDKNLEQKENLTVEEAQQLVEQKNKAKAKAINLPKLENLTSDVATALAKFGWGDGIFLNWLTGLDVASLTAFKDGECKYVSFSWGKLVKEDGNWYVKIGEKEYKDITDNICNLLIGKKETEPSITVVNEKKENYSDYQKIEQILNDELKILGINSEIFVRTNGDGKYYLHIPKSLWNNESMNVLYDPSLKQYIKTQVDSQNEEIFILPADIKIWLIKNEKTNDLILWDHEKKDWFLTLNTESSKFTGDPEIYPNLGDNPSLQVNSTETSWTSVSEEEEQEKKTEKESKNEYKNLENNKYWEVPAEVVDSNYDALIDYMDWKENNNLIQAFQRLEINPNSIANTLAQVLSENPEVTKFERKHISNEAMKQLGRNKKLFVNEKNNLVKILNNVERGKLQQFINEMKVFNDIRELQKTKKFVEMNKEKIKKNPFLILSDFGKDWTVDTWEKWIKHHWRTSEQAMYDVFVSLANTDVLTEKRENVQSYKVIIDWPKTADLVKWFVSLMKTVWEDRYNDIEREFNWEYTMNKLWEYIVTHRETLVLYQQTINSLSYNSSMDIQDLVSDSRRKSIVDRGIQEIKELITNRDEVNNRFESQLWKNEEFDKWFKALSAQEQKNFVWNMAVWLDEWWILPTIVKTFWINSKTWVTVDNLDAVDIDFNFFKDDAWIWPRIALIGPLQGGLGFHLDIPIANLTANFDLNHRAVENSVIHGANPVHQLYTRLWANVGWWIVVGWKTDEKFSAYFSAAIEWALWWKADYKKWIELNARNFGNVLQNGIFKDPDFTTKENFKEKAKKSIEDILNWTDKENKNLRKFMKNNKQEMDNCVENVSNLLDVMWAFGPDKKPEHKKILLDSIMKGIVEEVKNQNLWELDGRTKLTRLWIFGQAWVGFDAKKLFQWDFKWAFGAGWSVWLEATLSAWNMIYLPDKEKYNYMDAQLKSWESIKPIGEWIKTNNIENMKNAIAQSLSENSIPNIEVKSNNKNQIEISVTDAVLQKYGKKNIYELFNIYVNPDKKNNVAISEDGKTLTMGWNNLENFSVATRRYFDDFAVYLMIWWIWWKWIDGCGNNKINGETISEYNSAWHLENVPWFEFVPSTTTETTQETHEYNVENWFWQTEDPFKQFEKSLEKLDNGKWISYVEFMEATCDLDEDIVNESDYIDAFKKIQKMLDASTDQKLQSIKNYVNGVSDINEKVFVVDRFKMIFSLVNWTDSKKWLENLAKKRWTNYETLMWYDKSIKFPLEGESYRAKLLNQIWDGKVDRITDANLVGMTAFYKRGHVSSTDNILVRQQLDQAYWYSMTRIWATDYLGILYDIEESRLETTKEWFKKNLEKTEIHRNILKKSIWERIKEQIGTDVEITDAQLYDLLQWKNIDIFGKKVKIETRYVFYLLWECANESVWVQLWKLTIANKPGNDNPDNPDNPEDNVLEVWVDGQTLTKTESLNQNDVSAKVNILGGKIEGSEDSWYWGQTNQEWTTWEWTWTGWWNTWQWWGVWWWSWSGWSNTGNWGGWRP